MSDLVIDTRGLRKEFGPKVAVADLTLNVRAGEVFGFLGPNGAGKTTSIKMLLSLTTPTAGEATLLGRPLGDRPARAKIGYLPEHFRFHEWLRADEFLNLHGELYGMDRAARGEAVPCVRDSIGSAACMCASARNVAATASSAGSSTPSRASRSISA